MYSPKPKDRAPNLFLNPDYKNYDRWFCPKCHSISRYEDEKNWLFNKPKISFFTYIETIGYKQEWLHLTSNNSATLCGVDIVKDKKLKLWKKILNTLYGIMKRWL